MSSLYDLAAPKKATNLSVNSDLLQKSKALNINLSATLEQALSQELAQNEAERWQQQNRNAIKAYNEAVEEQGCFSDEHRVF